MQKQANYICPGIQIIKKKSPQFIDGGFVGSKKSNSKKEKPALRKTSQKKPLNALDKPWWESLPQYTVREGLAATEQFDQHNNPRVKLAGDTSFTDVAGSLEGLLKKDYAKRVYARDDTTPIIFSSPVSGGDDGISLYAALARGKPKEAAAPIIGLFHDASDWKLDFLIARLYIAAASPTPQQYLDTLLMTSAYFGADKKDTNLYHQLQAVADWRKIPPAHQDHLEHILKKIQELKLDPREYESVHAAVERLVQVLHWKRTRSNYKIIAEELQNDLQANSEKHWLRKGYQSVREAVNEKQFRFLHLDLDHDLGREKYLKFLKVSEIPDENLYVLALPKAPEKFKRTKVLARAYRHFLSTVQSTGLLVDKRWVMDAPHRIFQYDEPPIEEVFGTLSAEALEELRKARQIRVEKNVKENGSAKMVILGDVGIGSPSYTERTKRVLEYTAQRSQELGTDSVILVGSPIAGVPETEKQMRGRFYTKEPFPTITAQVKEAATMLAKFKGKKYAIKTDDIEVWINTVAEHMYDAKLEGIKTEGAGQEYARAWKYMSKDTKKQIKHKLRVESYFEAVDECCDLLDRELQLDSPIVDRLCLDYTRLKWNFKHKRPSQYFSKHTGPKTVRQDAKLQKQRAARTDDESGRERSCLITAHNLDLRVQPYSPNQIQISVPAAADIEGHLAQPEEIQRDNWSMAHKKIAVEGKFTDVSTLLLEETEDGRYIFEPIVLDLMRYLQPDPSIPEKRVTCFSTGDAQTGSLANKHVIDILLKYLDYTAFELPKQNKDVKWSLAWWTGGDCAECHNYALAPLRNIVPDIGEQVSLFTQLCAPFVEKKNDKGYTVLNPLIEKVIHMRGNHEMNSTDRRQAFSASDAIAEYYRGLLKAQYGSMEKVDDMLPYGQRHMVERFGHKEELFNLMAGYAKVCNYPILGSHFFEPGSPLGNDFTVPVVNWLDRAGEMAKEYALMFQWHWHNFGLASHAGKLIVSFPAPTGMSDYEYKKALSPQYMMAFVHLSNKHLPRIEVLTNKWFENYKMQHPEFQKMSPAAYDQYVRAKIAAPVQLFGAGQKLIVE